MGRARIIHNYGEGQYAIEISLDISRLEKRRAALQRQIAELEPTLPGLAATYDNLRADYEQKSAELTVEIQIGQGTDIQKNRKLEKLAKELTILGRQMIVAGHNYDSARLKLLCLQSELSSINDMPSAINRDAWCADYSDELPIGAIVGTIDLARHGFDPERSHWILQPCFEKSVYYDPKRDGMLQNTAAATPAAAYFNFAVNPGLSKWLPRYRTATVTAVNIDADTVDVDVHPAYFARFDVNQSERLERVPVRYMDTNAAVFEEGDDVVVMFRGNDWNDPVVIGFEHDPKLLPPVLVVRISGYNKHWTWGFHHGDPYNGNWLISPYSWQGGADDPSQPLDVEYIIVLDPLTGELVQLDGGLTNPCRSDAFYQVYRNPIYFPRANVTKPYLSATGGAYFVGVNEVVVRKEIPMRSWRFDHDFTPPIYDAVGKHDDWTIRPMTWTMASYSADCAIPNRSFGPETMHTDFVRMRVSGTVMDFYHNAWNAALLNRVDLDKWAAHETGETTSTYYEEQLGYSRELSSLQTYAADDHQTMRLEIDTPHYADNPKLGEPFEISPLTYVHTYARTDRDESSYTDEDNWVRDDGVRREMEFQCQWQSPGGHQFSAPATVVAREHTYMSVQHGEVVDAAYSAGFEAKYTCGLYQSPSACGPSYGSAIVTFAYFRPLTVTNTHDWDMVNADPGWINSYQHGGTDIYVEALWSPEQYAPLASLRRLDALENIIKSILNDHITYERNYDEWPDEYEFGDAYGEGISKKYGTNIHEVFCTVRFWRLHKR